MGEQKKVLIVEDDKFLANAYRVKLSKAGFELQVVNDGQEAINALENFKPHLIILDLVMPVKDGFTTLKEIRQMDKYKETPVIISSNLGQKENIDKGLGLGATDYIVKSEMSLDDVTKKVNSILGLEI